MEGKGILIGLALGAAVGTAIYFAMRKTSQAPQAPEFNSGGGEGGGSYTPSYNDQVRSMVQPLPPGTKLNTVVTRTAPRVYTDAEKKMLTSIGVNVTEPVRTTSSSTPAPTTTSPTRTTTASTSFTTMKGLFGTHG